MKNTPFRLLIGLLTALSLTVLIGCTGGGTDAVTAAEVDTAGAAKKAMTQYDANQDGFIDKAELKTASSIAGALEEIDANADGKVSESELADILKTWKESGTNITSANARVMKGGPIAEATVTLIPEDFLGGAVTQATCTTNAQGGGVLSSEKAKGMGLDGLSPGFYKIKVTKGDKEFSLKVDGAAISPYARSNDVNITAK